MELFVQEEHLIRASFEEQDLDSAFSSYVAFVDLNLSSRQYTIDQTHMLNHLLNQLANAFEKRDYSVMRDLIIYHLHNYFE